MHAVVLHTGQLLFFAGSGNDPDKVPPQDFRTACWSSPEPVFTGLATPIDFFCVGQATLADGKGPAAGGTTQYDPFRGLRDAYLYDPAHGQRAATHPMAGERWYPTLMGLGDGNVLAASGLDEDGNLNVVPEVYDVATGH